MRKQRNRTEHVAFTLLEVVVAIAVLAAGLAGYFSLSGAAQRRTAAAMEKWRDRHMLIQAAEYYLLYGEDAPEIPADIFPYQPRYSVRCEYAESENIPEDFTALDGQTALRTVKVDLFRSSDNRILDSIIVERYVDEDDTAE